MGDQEPMADKRSGYYNSQIWWLFGGVFVLASYLEAFARLSETLHITEKPAQDFTGGANGCKGYQRSIA